MLKDKLVELREILNHLSITEGLNSSTVIEISRDMDQLILEYYRSWEKDAINITEKISS